MFKPRPPVTQRGINLVDLMMWLVIAALVLAAALQSINYYQKTANVHNAKSDVHAEHGWANGKNADNGKAPGPDQLSEALSNGDLKLTKGNTAIYAKYGEKYCIGVKSANLEGNNVFYSSSDAPSTILNGTEMPASCGTITDFAAAAALPPATPIVAPPTDQPVVTGSVVTPTTVKFVWTPINNATSYLIEKQVNGGVWTVVPEGVPNTESVITGSPGDSIVARVTPVNSGGSGPTSLTSTAIALPPANSFMAVWGNNNDGVLGDATLANTYFTNSPIAFSMNNPLAGKVVTAVSSGDFHSCAIADGAGYCWGLNNGRLGNGKTTDSKVPVAVDTTGVLKGKTLTMIDGQEGNNCALTTESKAYCWGNTSYKQLGKYWANGNSPVDVDMTGTLLNKTFTDISVGSIHVCSVASAAAYCWGTNVDGELGTGNTTDSYTALKVNGLLTGKTVTSIASSKGGSCAVADGKVYCWGKNDYGQLGNNGAVANSTLPVAVDMTGVLAGKTVASVTAGWFHYCALTTDGKAYCWGGNRNVGGAIGQLGNNSTVNSKVPVAVDTTGVLAGKTIDKLNVGASTSCALSGGKAYCWGSGQNSQIGNGLKVDSYVPVAVDTSGVLSGVTIKGISTGLRSTLVY